ncbi:hypothetical protein EDB89DRAFT_2064332 [Lactarius sanguifluus]|nr:hypothetical protein EDB89DRAFT_2064332 [Lactarius sanguifluus]
MPRRSNMVLVRYDANAVWSRYDSDSAPRCDTDAAPQQLGAATWRYDTDAAAQQHATTPYATRRRHANSDAAWSRCDSDTPPATSANDSDAALQQYGAATEID